MLNLHNPNNPTPKYLYKIQAPTSVRIGSIEVEITTYRGCNVYVHGQTGILAAMNFLLRSRRTGVIKQPDPKVQKAVIERHGGISPMEADALLQIHFEQPTYGHQDHARLGGILTPYFWEPYVTTWLNACLSKAGGTMPRQLADVIKSTGQAPIDVLPDSAKDVVINPPKKDLTREIFSTLPVGGSRPVLGSTQALEIPEEF